MLQFRDTPAGGCVIHSVLRNAAKDAAFMLAAGDRKGRGPCDARNDTAWNTLPPTSYE
jgi:hypothetical protein